MAVVGLQFLDAGGFAVPEVGRFRPRGFDAVAGGGRVAGVAVDGGIILPNILRELRLRVW